MKEQQNIKRQELTGFENLLASVPVESLPVSDYAKRYLQHIIDHKRFYCRLYAHLLNLSIKNCCKERKDISLVDYGAGNGLMGLLAKYCGFGKVFINDLNADFIEAAKAVSKATKIIPDGFIEGDIENVQTYFIAEPADVIVGTDVIEHIYSLQHFFTTVNKINPAMITVMNTACNPVNPFRVKQIRAMHYKDEYEGGTPNDHTLFGAAAHESFIEIRKKIIRNFANDKLSDKEVDTLTTLTRGLHKADIEIAIEKYLVEKKLPVALSHPTNTCDPLTGSWSERMLSFEEYKNIYSNAGFEVEIYDGLYNSYEPTLKSKVLFFANLLTPLTGHRLSQSITLVGKR